MSLLLTIVATAGVVSVGNDLGGARAVDADGTDGPLAVTGTPVGLREAVAQALPSLFDGPGGSSCVVDTSAVLGWWAGEGGGSATIGSPLSGPVGFGSGLVGSTFAFDGAQSASLDGFPVVSGEVSVEAWVKPDRAQSQVLVSRWDFPSTDDGARSFALSLTASGSLLWSTDETSTRRPVEFAVPIPTIYDGGWHHVAATWGGGQMRVFFDGVQAGSRAAQAGVLNPATSTPLRLGAKNGRGNPRFFSGGMDEPTVWGRALSATEVAAIHAAGSAGKCTSGGVVSQQAKLTASDGASSDVFGVSVSVFGDTAIVGAPNTDGTGQNSGSAYIFVRSGTTWTQQAELVASDAAEGDNFGGSVALDGDTAVVGALRDDDAGTESGSSYVFLRTGTTWSQQAKLTASDAAANDRFGVSVAINADSVIVGADLGTGAATRSGSAYVFERTGSVWTERAELAATDGATGDSFGRSVAIDGTTTLVGSLLDRDAGYASGSAYVFAQDGSVWFQQAKLTASDATSGDFFGTFVDLDGTRGLIGAHNDSDAGTSSGSAYVFARSGAAWSQEAKLTASDAQAEDIFGYSGSIDGSTAIVGGSWNDDAGVNSGSAYVFGRSGAIWSERSKLVASDAEQGDTFGHAVSLDNGTAIIGSYGDRGVTGPESGSAYIFTGL